MSHLDRTVQDKGKLLELAQLGCLMEYDLFGIECSHYQVYVTVNMLSSRWLTSILSHFQFNRNVDMLSDAQRLERIKLLVDSGYAHRVVIAQDIHLKHRLVYTYM